MKKLKLILPEAVCLKFKTKDGIIETNKKGEIEVEDEEVIASLLRSGFKLVDQHELDEAKAKEDTAREKKALEESAAKEIANAKAKAKADKEAAKAKAKADKEAAKAKLKVEKAKSKK